MAHWFRGKTPTPNSQCRPAFASGRVRRCIYGFFFEHVRRRSRNNISGVQDRPAHPLLLSNSPRWSTTCVVAEAGGLTHVEACFLVAVLVTSFVTQELIRSLGNSGSTSVQTLGMIPRTVQPLGMIPRTVLSARQVEQSLFVFFFQNRISFWFTAHLKSFIWVASQSVPRTVPPQGSKLIESDRSAVCASLCGCLRQTCLPMFV